MPYDIRADEMMIVSNMSIARIVGTKWTGLGGKQTGVSIQDDAERIPALDLEHRNNCWEAG